MTLNRELKDVKLKEIQDMSLDDMGNIDFGQVDTPIQALSHDIFILERRRLDGTN